MNPSCSLPAPTGAPYRIAFVCLGNICRSPMADVVLTQLLDDAGLATKVEVTSCGTGTWHLGEPMDPRAAAQLLAEGYDASAHRAQKFDAELARAGPRARHGRQEPRRHHRRAAE